MKGLNIKGLCKQIKASKHFFLWSFDGVKHFLTNRHWAVTFEQLPIEVFVVLLQMFEGQQPAAGECLKKYREAVKTIPCPTPPKAEGAANYEWTDYYKDYDGGFMRIFKGGDELSFVNKEYLHAVEWGMPVVGYGKNMMIEFPELNYIVLPIRVEHQDGLLGIMKAMGD